MSENLLDVQNITLRFGGVTAINDVSFDVQPDELFAMLAAAGLEPVDRRGFVFNPLGWSWSLSVPCKNVTRWPSGEIFTLLAVGPVMPGLATSRSIVSCSASTEKETDTSPARRVDLIRRIPFSGE